MFSKEIDELTRIYEQIQSEWKQELPLPEALKNEICQYLDAPKPIVTGPGPCFEISESSNFFINQWYSNCHYAAKVSGQAITFAGMMYLGIPALLIDGLIHCCRKKGAEFNFYVSRFIVFNLDAIGAILGLIFSMIPAFIHAGSCALRYKYDKTKQQTSGKEIYESLLELGTKIEEKPSTGTKIIENIIEAYKESFHKDDYATFSALLFPPDKNSEDLYQILATKIPNKDKWIAIKDYMKTVNQNAGKNLFHIILDKIESTPDVIDNYDWEPGYYWRPSLLDDPAFMI